MNIFEPKVMEVDGSDDFPAFKTGEFLGSSRSKFLKGVHIPLSNDGLENAQYLSFVI